MMWSNYYESGPTSVAEVIHEAIVEGTQVICNYVLCDYVETFNNLEDAVVAAEIHERQDE